MWQDDAKWNFQNVAFGPVDCIGDNGGTSCVDVDVDLELGNHFSDGNDDAVVVEVKAKAKRGRAKPGSYQRSQMLVLFTVWRSHQYL